MLVLLRKVGQAIVIDGQFVVTVTKVRPNRVSLGITAPAGVPVHRKEIALRNSAKHGPDDPRSPVEEIGGGNGDLQPERPEEPEP